MIAATYCSYSATQCTGLQVDLTELGAKTFQLCTERDVNSRRNGNRRMAQ